MLESLGAELASTEMFLSVFYGVLDPRQPPAGLRQRRPPARLPDSRRPAPPERLHHRAAARPRRPDQHQAARGALGARRATCSASGPTAWWTSGAGEGFSEERLLAELAHRRSGTPEAIVRGGVCRGRQGHAEPGRRPHPAGPANLTAPPSRPCSRHPVTFFDAPGQEAPRPAFPARSRHPRAGSPTRSASRPGDTVLEIGPGPAGSPRSCAPRATRSSPSKRTATWCRGCGSASPAPPSSRAMRCELDWHALAGPGPVRIVRQHSLQHHLAPARAGAAAAAAPVDRLPGAEGGGRAGRGRSGRPRIRGAERRHPGRGPGGAAVHRAGRRLPPAAQGGLRRAPAHAAGGSP